LYILNIGYFEIQNIGGINNMENEIKREMHLIGGLFRKLFDKFNRMENKKYLYKDIKDLTLAEINTILVIGPDDMKSMSQIANSLGVSFGTPTVTIDRLINKGYVDRIRDEEDRRQVFVRLSEEGRKVFGIVMDLKEKVMEKVLGILDADERKILITVFSKLNNKFDEAF
jgi:DNA-binding MarR family transcriptional regulator